MSEKVKRYVLMGGSIYYASGGFKDYLSSHDTEEEAKTALEKWFESQGDSKEYSWAHVGDLETGQMWVKGEACNPMGMFR